MAEKNDKARWYALPEYKVAECSECGSLYPYRKKMDFLFFALCIDFVRHAVEK